MRLKSKKALFFYSTIILISSIIICVYIGGCIFFKTHFYIGTSVNGIDLSCTKIQDYKSIADKKEKEYKLRIIGKDCIIEEIGSEEIDLSYELENIIETVKKEQNPYLWFISLLKNESYENDDGVIFNEEKLIKKYDSLVFFDPEKVIEPKNAAFIYDNGVYTVEGEIEGNKVKKDILYAHIINSINRGKDEIDISSINCYYEPNFRVQNKEALEVKNILNKMVSSKITYKTKDGDMTLDGEIINNWLSVDNSYKIKIDEKGIKKYVTSLSKSYNTVGKKRKFITSGDRVVEVSGGDYGTSIDIQKEVEELRKIIKDGSEVIREPIYSQRALVNGQDDIGRTYVEINLSSQYIWFYKNGELIVEGNVVTGNEARGNKTPTGVYYIKFKQQDVVLKGDNYESKVRYWMPFNGGIGIHDASWRYSFGGEIYKNNGSHGCVNSPLYVAKSIYEQIEPGTPVICYKIDN